MGHHVFLDSFDPQTRALATSSKEGEAKACMPLFWLALFEASDLREAPVPEVHYAPRPGQTFALEPPFLLADNPTALARLRRRTPALEVLCDASHVTLLRSFTAYVRRLQPCVVMRLGDLAMGRPDFLTTVHAVLALIGKLDQPGLRPRDYLVEPLTTFFPSHWRTSPRANVLLAGDGWLPTKAERVRDQQSELVDRWEQAIADRPPESLPPYAASRTYQPDELVLHPKLGPGVVLRTLEGDKVEVLFRDGARTLVHGRR